jgi:hypothetical protein
MILDALDAGARAKGGHLRPGSSSIWAAYSGVSYEVYYGEAQKNDVWAQEYLTDKMGEARRDPADKW